MRSVDRQYFPAISIKPGYISFYHVPDKPFNRTTSQLRSALNLRNNSSKGYVSDASRKRLSNAIDWLVYKSKPQKIWSPQDFKYINFRLSFITLTLPAAQKHSDNHIKEHCLNQWLTEMRQSHGLKDYVWRAEAQGNGNIHFHITANRYIHHSVIRKVWNRCLSKAGYIQQYRTEQENWHKNGFQPRPELFKEFPLHQQYKAYCAGFAGNWSDPNTTDVRTVRKLADIGRYMAKELGKNGKRNPALKFIRKDSKEWLQLSDSERGMRELDIRCIYRLVEGRLWGQSQSLSMLRSYSDIDDGYLADELRYLIACNPSKFKQTQYTSVLYCNAEAWKKYGCRKLMAFFSKWYEDQVNPPPPLNFSAN